MLGRKAFGLVQRLARHHGHTHVAVDEFPVKDQILNRIGRPAFQRRADLGHAAGLIRAGRIDGGHQQLLIRQDQLGRQPARAETQRCRPKIRQRFGQVRRIEGDTTNHKPAP